MTRACIPIYLGKRHEGCLNPGIWGQSGQHSETFSSRIIIQFTCTWCSCSYMFLHTPPSVCVLIMSDKISIWYFLAVFDLEISFWKMVNRVFPLPILPSVFQNPEGIFPSTAYLLNLVCLLLLCYDLSRLYFVGCVETRAKESFICWCLAFQRTLYRTFHSVQCVKG